jgi:hypothetical protein
VREILVHVIFFGAELALGPMLDPLIMYTGPFYFFMQVLTKNHEIYGSDSMMGSMTEILSTLAKTYGPREP